MMARGLAAGVGEVLAFRLAVGVAQGLAGAAPSGSKMQVRLPASSGTICMASGLHGIIKELPTHDPHTLTVADDLRVGGYGLCAAPMNRERRLGEL